MDIAFAERDPQGVLQRRDLDVSRNRIGDFRQVVEDPFNASLV